MASSAPGRRVCARVAQITLANTNLYTNCGSETARVSETIQFCQQLTEHTREWGESLLTRESAGNTWQQQQ